MPATPFHYFLAYILHRMSKSSLNFPALIVGSMVPDLEVPIIFIISRGEIDRLVLHSILGSITLGLLITIAISFLIHPRLVGLILPNDREDLKRKCTISKTLVMSGVIGVLGHVLLDALHHEYNPLIYPFSKESINDLVLFGDYLLASELIVLLFVISGLMILLREIRLGRDGFLKRILAG